MIQRAQTIYLGLAFLCMVLLLFFPIFSVEMSSANGDVSLAGMVNKDGVVIDGMEASGIPLSGFFIGLALFSMACILMYKKRPRQLLLTRLNLILHALFILAIYIFYYFGKSLVQEGVSASSDVTVHVTFFMEVGFFLLIPTVAFIYLAVRGIKRDENLVQSLDRLR